MSNQHVRQHVGRQRLACAPQRRPSHDELSTKKTSQRRSGTRNRRGNSNSHCFECQSPQGYHGGPGV